MLIKTVLKPYFHLYICLQTYYTDIKNNFTVRMYTFDESSANPSKSIMANSIVFEKRHLYFKEIENV